MNEVRGRTAYAAILDEVSDFLNKPVPEYLQRTYVEAYFDQMGCTVDFATGEVRSKKDGTLRAVLDQVILDGDRFTLNVKLVQQLHFVTCDITVGKVQG
jgi:hypothetical protein